MAVDRRPDPIGIIAAIRKQACSFGQSLEQACGKRRVVGIHQPVPHSRLAPAIEAIEDCGPRPLTLKQINLGRARTQVMNNTIENTPVINVGHAARLLRKQRLDGLSLKLSQVIASMSLSPPPEIESFATCFA